MQRIIRHMGQVRWPVALMAGACFILGLTLPARGDSPSQVAVDASGNVYVTGSSWNGNDFDYVTIKYNASGSWVWGRRYNGPANGNDDAMALAVDAGGNVYVTGRSWNGANYDYVTIKYNAAGTWVWGRRYNGPANEWDVAKALALDSGGNVYVTGESWTGSNYDYVTIKYNAAGVWVWGRRFNAPANGDDQPQALKVDTSGNVYVTGGSWGIGSGFDYVTIKYNSAGAWVWGNRYNGPANTSDVPQAIAVDASGSVYVTGDSYNGANADYVTIKYNASGAWLWGQRYSGPASSWDSPVALAVDAAGNVYVTGDSYNAANSDYVTIKYSPSGAWLWGQRFNSPDNDSDYAAALAMEASGNVYVTGYSWNGANNDYVTIKYSTAGAWVWGQRFNGPANGYDYAAAVAVDASGNAYVTGDSWNGANYDYVTIKYSTAGAWVWGARYDGPD